MVAQGTRRPPGEDCSVKRSSLQNFPSLVDKKASSVSFNSAQDEIHEIPSAINLSKREKLVRWRSDNEFAACIYSCKREIHRLYIAPYDIFQFRGLELVDPDTCMARQKRYMQEVSAVKREQQHQKQQGICDANGIQTALTSQVSFERAMKKALDNAFVDNMAVKEYLADAMLELEAEYKAQKEKEAKKRLLGGFGFNSLRRSFSLRRSLSHLNPKKKTKPT